MSPWRFANQLRFANQGHLSNNLPFGWQPGPRGLTLLELVVVLGILAVLSTVAIRTLEPIADQARYEQTQSVLNHLRHALVGSAEPIGGALATVRSSFIPDTGSLPLDWDCLMVRPPSLIERSLQTFDSDRDSINDIHLTSGWNGPYMTLGAGVTEILDGWGAEPALILDSGALEILSLGSDGDSISPEGGYRSDISLTVQPKDYQGALVFKLYAIDTINGSRIDPSPTGSEQLGVLFYGVNATGGSAGAIEEQLIVIANNGSFEFRRDNTFIGTTAVRAIVWNDLDNDDALDPGEAIIAKSIVHYAEVHPSLDTRLELELR